MTRLEGWLADRRVHLARSWDAFSHWYWVGRYQLADRFSARQDKLAEWFWVRWYRFTDWVVGPWERLADWYWARRDADGGSKEAPSGSLPRPSTLTFASIFVVLTLAAAVTIRPLMRASDSTTALSIPRLDAPLGVDVPDVRGMSVSEARAVLERAGLKFERATAAVGMPGQVLGTLPSIGRSVASGTQVTLIVGVQAERIATSNTSTGTQRAVSPQVSNAAM